MRSVITGVLLCVALVLAVPTILLLMLADCIGGDGW